MRSRSRSWSLRHNSTAFAPFLFRWTDFAGILDDLRLDLAHHYLRNASLSVSEIAWLLGFREFGAFTHAFKRWTNVCFRDLRQAPGTSRMGAKRT